MPFHNMGHYGNGPEASANQAAIGTAFTDSTGGSAGTTLAAGVGIETLLIPVTLAQIAGAGDVLTTITLGYKFKLLSFNAFVVEAVTTAAKAATLNLEIGTTNVTGGTIALTSANCTPLGATVAGAAITAANTGSSSATVSVEAASVTAFAEGAVVLQVRVQNMDTADAVASLSARANSVRTLLNQIRSDLITNDIIKGSA